MKDFKRWSNTRVIETNGHILVCLFTDIKEVNSVNRTSKKNFWAVKNSSCQTPHIKWTQNSLTPPSSPLTLSLYWPLRRGFLSLIKPAPYTMRTPCVGGKRERGKPSARPSSKHDSPKLRLFSLFSSFPPAFCSVLCNTLKVPKTSFSSHGKGYGRSFPGHMNTDEPKVCLVGHSVLWHTLGLTNVKTT